MATRTVWAYKRLPELDHKIGFVNCELELAASLIASGEAQAPNMGQQQKHIDFSWPEPPEVEAAKKPKRGKYQNKELTSDRGELLARDNKDDDEVDE